MSLKVAVFIYEPINGEASVRKYVAAGYTVLNY